MGLGNVYIENKIKQRSEHERAKRLDPGKRKTTNEEEERRRESV